VQPFAGQLGVGRKSSDWWAKRSAPSAFCTTCAKRTPPSSNSLRHFRKHSLPVPEIYAEDLDHGAYLEEDWGHVAVVFLSSIARASRSSLRRSTPTGKSSRRCEISDRGGPRLNYKVCYPRGVRSQSSPGFELFQYYFLRLAGIPSVSSVGRRFQKSDEVSC